MQPSSLWSRALCPAHGSVGRQSRARTWRLARSPRSKKPTNPHLDSGLQPLWLQLGHHIGHALRAKAGECHHRRALLSAERGRHGSNATLSASSDQRCARTPNAQVMAPPRHANKISCGLARKGSAHRVALAAGGCQESTNPTHTYIHTLGVAMAVVSAPTDLLVTPKTLVYPCMAGNAGFPGRGVERERERPLPRFFPPLTSAPAIFPLVPTKDVSMCTSVLQLANGSATQFVGFKVKVRASAGSMRACGDARAPRPQRWIATWCGRRWVWWSLARRWR